MPQFNPFPELTSQRLRLRKLDNEDVHQVFSLRSDDQVNFFLDRQPASSINDAQLFIDRINNNLDKNGLPYWAICLKENPRLIGTICYFDFSPSDQSAEIGYELHPFYQKKGIMQEAIAIVIHFGFKVLQLKTITAFLSHDNLSSIKLLEKNGFKKDESFLSEGNGRQFVRYILNHE